MRWKRPLAHAEELERQGAVILDIGGESTRPGAAEVSADEELARVLPVVRELRKRSEAVISVDTRQPPWRPRCWRRGRT